MKKFLVMGAAVALAMGFSACQNEDLALSKGGESTVSFAVSLPINPNSRAEAADLPGQGDRATNLYYAIYKSGSTDLIRTNDADCTDTDKYVAEIPTFTNVGGKYTAQLSVNLVVGKSYDFVFWAAADDGSGKAYNFNYEDQTVTVNYDKINNNDEALDAFFKGETLVITEGMNKTIELKRPFAQLNIGTDDLVEAAAGGIATGNLQTSVKVPVYSQFNVFTGDLEGSFAEQEFQVKPITEIAPQSPLTITEYKFPVDHATAGKAYEYISLSYLLVDNRDLVDVEFNLTDGVTPLQRKYSQVPVQRNYRTNIYGSLLTTNAVFTIEINPIFENPDNNVYIATEAELTAALNAGGDYVLIDDIALTNNIVATAPVNLDLNNNNLNAGANRFGVYNDVPVTISNGTINGTLNNVQLGLFDVGSDSNPNNAGSLTLDGVNLNTPGSAGIALHGKSTLVLNKTNITAAVYCIATNATTPLVQDLDITINGGTYTGNSPIFVNVPCNLKMTDVVVNGSMHGVVVRGGTAVINGGEINMIYDESESKEDADSMANYFVSRNWGTGNTLNLGALVIGNKAADSSTSYRYPSNVTLTDVAVSCKGNYASKFPNVYLWANPGDGQGITFNYDPTCTFNGGQGIIVGNTENLLINGAAPTSTGAFPAP